MGGVIDMRKLLTKKNMIFVSIFSVVAFIAMQINFSQLVGAESQFFTLFQFFGPITGAILGPIFGSISVLLAELINFFIVGKEINIMNLFRLAPMVLAAVYFGTKGKGKLATLIPIAAMIGFWLHPIGNQVWYFALFWTIPLIVKFLPDNLLFRSLGSTFTAHAVGGVLWIWAVPASIMTVGAWQSLIPIVMYERTLFTLGIAVSYIGFNTLLSKIDSVLKTNVLQIDSKYILSRKMFGLKA